MAVTTSTGVRGVIGTRQKRRSFILRLGGTIMPMRGGKKKKDDKKKSMRGGQRKRTNSSMRGARRRK